MINVFLTMLGAILAENIVLTKMYGFSPFMRSSDKPSGAAWLGAVLTAVMTVTSALTFAVYRYALIPLKLEMLRTVLFVLVIAGTAALIGVALKRYAPALYASLGVTLPVSAINCATLGAVLLSTRAYSSIADSALFGLASGIGFTLAIVIFAGARAKMALSDPPKAFKGYPILLIAAGLVALAFSGLAGLSFS